MKLKIMITISIIAFIALSSCAPSPTASSTNSVSIRTESTNQGSSFQSKSANTDDSTVLSETTFTPQFTSNELNTSIISIISGNSFHENNVIQYTDLRILNLSYYDYDGIQKQGEMICNKLIADDLLEIFKALYEAKYPIESIQLIDQFNADDSTSMKANNTSCFNYRKMTSSAKLSKHAYGLAIDINPLYNPYVKTTNGVAQASIYESQPYTNREEDFPYKIIQDDLCYQLFIEHGFTWGGDWRNSKDYQHFEKNLNAQ